MAEALGSRAGAHKDTRQRILDVARALFSEGGYLGVSMSEIAKCVGVTKGALYHHFEGKDAIYGAVLEDVFSRLSSQIADALEQKTAETRLRRLIDNYLRFGMHENNLINTIVTDLPPGDPVIRRRVVHFRQEVADQVQPIVEQNMAEAVVARVGDIRFATSLLMSMMDGLLLECSLFDTVPDTSKIADYLVAIIGRRDDSLAGA
jgi:AcrR family transcriptional regulator